MLNPPLDKLKEKVNSKYLIVSLAAKRAGKIHITSEHPEE